MGKVIDLGSPQTENAGILVVYEVVVKLFQRMIDTDSRG